MLNKTIVGVFESFFPDTIVPLSPSNQLNQVLSSAECETL